MVRAIIIVFAALAGGVIAEKLIWQYDIKTVSAPYQYYKCKTPTKKSGLCVTIHSQCSDLIDQAERSVSGNASDVLEYLEKSICGFNHYHPGGGKKVCCEKYIPEAHYEEIDPIEQLWIPESKAI